MTFSDVLLGHAEEHTDTHMRVAIEHWATAVAAAKEAGFSYFSFLSGIDWLPNPALDGEHHYDTGRAEPEAQDVVTDPEIRKAGGASRFVVFTHLENVTEHTAITLTADVGDEMRVPSITHVFRGADWHERETWEMYGFVFDGHPNLRHIYLPEEFDGFPLRKDYALPARLVRPWPGLVDMEEMPEVEAAEPPESDFA